MSQGNRKNGPSELPGDRKPSKRSKPTRDDFEEDEEVRPKKKRTPQKSAFPKMAIWIAVGAVLVIGVGVYPIIDGVIKHRQEMQRNAAKKPDEKPDVFNLEENPNYIGLDTWQRNGNISIKIRKPRIGKVRFGDETETLYSKENLLSFDVYIWNHDENETFEYKSWEWNAQVNRVNSMNDQLGQTIPFWIAPNGKLPDGAIREASIAPGQQVKDVFVYEAPKPNSKLMVVNYFGRLNGLTRIYSYRIFLKDIAIQ